MDSRIEILISEVQKKPILYNTKDKNYRNRVLVDKAWKIVSSKAEFPNEYVKQKWKNLRDQFRKELHKIPVSCSGDEATEADIKWPYFQSMLFLRDILQPRPTKSNLDKSKCFDDSLESLSESNESENINENYEHDSIDQSNNRENDQVSDSTSYFKRPSSEFVVSDEESSQIKKSKTKKRLQKEDGNSSKMTEFEKHMITLESQKLQMLQGPGDEDLNFFKSLLPYFKKLPDLSKMNVRTQIQNIVFQEYTKVIQMNERYSTMNNYARTVPISISSTPSTSEMSPVPSSLNLSLKNKL